MENDELEWTQRERAVLAAVLRASAPPAELEDRVVGRLAKAGLVVRRRAPVAHWSGLLAAGVALLLVGFGIGRWQAPVADAGSRTRYLLLMREDKFFRPDRAPLALHAEVGRWAERLQGSGELIEGDRLGLHGELLATSGTPTGLAPGDVVSGFFVLRVASEERALAIARTCPHLTHGGRIEVRRIEPDGRIGAL
jgi:hypothetical protein